METAFFTRVREFFPFEPSEEQRLAFDKLEKFLRRNDGKQLFILKGYAGTGKTSVMGAFVQALNSYKVKTVLLAPTGRAAKVFGGKSNQVAMTIHKQIYRRKSKADLMSPISLQPNLFKNTVFFVDEASMIGDYTMQKDGSISSRNLLEDLLEYVYSGKNCRLVFIGDPGQLPPVGSDTSPALDLDYMGHYFPTLEIEEHVLKHVLRQAQDSEVLRNATILRNTEWVDYPKFDIKSDNDLIRINGVELQDELETSYSKYGSDDTILITRSNKRANEFNLQIRGRILWYEDQLNTGDVLMIVKNNYFWLGDDTQVGFIANGEMIRIKRIMKYETYYGFDFARVLVEFLDYEQLGEVEVIIHMESLSAEGPSLSRDRMKDLFYEIEKDYFHIREKKKRYEAILADPFFNALQVKYAYAVTCHKSQGGQWAHVYIDQGFINDDILGPDYYRWLYTALTRSTERVYLVNFDEAFFS